MSRLVARVGIDLYFMTANKDYLNVGLDLEFNSDDVFEKCRHAIKKRPQALQMEGYKPN